MKKTFTRRNSLLTTTALTAAGLMALTTAAYAVDDHATPVGENVVGGSASFSRPAAGTLNINQHTDRVIINWNSFNIGKNATTQFYQPGASSLAVNRVQGAGQDPTQILGSLKANGRVMVLDRNGVFFGPSSRLDVGGIIASTGDVDTAAIMGGAGKIELTNFGDGEVVNAGEINVAEAGLAAFVAPTVRNSGVINARLGKVALAAGSEKATLDLYGDGLVEFAVDSSKAKVLAENTGSINAEGGTVALSARAAKDVVDNVINMDGVVNVSSVTVKGGKIILGGGKSGKVNVSGKAKASGGGSVKISGQDIAINKSAEVAAEGAGGSVISVADRNGVYAGTFAAPTMETSASVLSVTDTFRALGNNWIIDPSNLTIKNAVGAGILNTLALEGFLNVVGVTAVSILTFEDGNLLEEGDIFVEDSVDWTTDATLYLTSFDDIIFNHADAALKSTGGGAVNLQAQGSVLLNQGEGVRTSGNIDVDAGGNVNIVSGYLDAQGGNIDIDQDGVFSSASSRVRTGGAGTITYRQNNGGSIQNAVAAISNTGSGLNMLTVAAGTYADNVTLNKANFRLIGANAGLSGDDALRGAETQINAPLNTADGIAIRAANVVVDGVSVSGGRHGISILNDADYVVVKNSLISATTLSGVHVRNSDSFEILENYISGTGEDGINVGRSYNGLIDNNTIVKSGQDGIDLERSDDTEVSNNTIDGAVENGIEWTLSINPYIFNNDIFNVSQRGIYALDNTNLEIRDNTVNRADMDGVYVRGASSSAFDVPAVNIVNNSITDVKGDGIQVSEVERSDYAPVMDKVAMVSEEEGSDYTVRIVDNYVDETDGDGIEVFDVNGNVYIADNEVFNAGFYSGYYGYYGDSFGSDGIHVRNVYERSAFKTLDVVDDSSSYDPDYYVKIVRNTVGQTGEGEVYAELSRVLSESETEGTPSILGSRDDGIEVLNSDRTIIRLNTISNAGAGIYGSSAGSLGDGDETGADGIHVANVYDYDYDGSYSLEIGDNTINVTGDDGIAVEDSGRTLIIDNSIGNAGAGDYGNGELSNNFGGSDFYGADGISVRNVRANDFAGYMAGRASVVFGGEDAADAGWIYSVEIINNDVTNTADDGIEVVGSGRTLIRSNDVVNAGFMDGYYGSYESVDSYGADGIHVRDTYASGYYGDYYGYYGYYSVPTSVEIINNTVNVDRETGEFTGHSADDGIQVLYSGDTLIDDNQVANSGIAGMGYYGYYGDCYGDYCYGSYYDRVDYWGEDGINVMTNMRKPSFARTDFIYPIYRGGANVEITDNTVDNSVDDGIEVIGGQHVLVDLNNVDQSGDEGIVVRYDGFYYDAKMSDDMSVMLLSGDPEYYNSAVVTNNVVNNSDYAGIEVSGYESIDASYNDVSNTANMGLFISGPFNGDVNVEGNTFTNNDVHAAFNSGLIDLTGDSNTFNGGRVGLLFSPVGMEPVLMAKELLVPVPFMSYLELVDDDAPGVSPAAQNPPTNFGGTIGKQIFNGQSQYFVQLENGAFFAPGSPTWLNGLNSTYNGLTPAATGGILTQAQLDTLENKFFHWVDDGSLGRFWFGAAPADINQEDIFNNFGTFALGGGQVNVVILGLPNLPGGGTNNPPFNFNDITPAAGEDDENGNPSDIEPAAGGEGGNEGQQQTAQNTSCWADATLNAQTGGATSFSFSSTIGEDTLEQQNNCGLAQSQ